MNKPINIKAGPTIVRYAQTHGINVDEVVAWGMAQVHGPFTPAQEWLEAMEPEQRFESWRTYVKDQCDASIAGRIKADLAMKEAA
jgi:hypothetical protein